MIYSPAILSLDTVMESAFTVTMCIDHVLCTIFLRHIRKTAAFFQNVGRRIVQEHDIFPVSIRLCKLEGFSQTLKLTFDQFLCMDLCFFIPTHDPAAEEEDLRKLAVRYVKRFIDAAGELECGRVLVTAGCGYYDHPADEAFRRSRDSLHEICLYAESRGVTMLLETLTPPSSNVLNTPEQQREMIKSMPEGSMFPILDLGQMAFMKQDLSRYLEHGEMLRHVHLHDTGAAVHMALGDGKAPILSILETLENAGYRHMYSFECNDPRYRADPAACDRQNLRWLEEHGVIE